MYDIDRALRRLELAHRLEELDRHRGGLPGPTPVPDVSAPIDVVGPDAPDSAYEQRPQVETGQAFGFDHSADPRPLASHADVDLDAPRTLPNGLPLRTPGTRFRTRPPQTPSSIVVPLGTPLMPSSASGKGFASNPPANDAPEYARPVTAWAADHDSSAGRGAFTPRPDLASASPPRDGFAPDGGSLPSTAPRRAGLDAAAEAPIPANTYDSYDSYDTHDTYDTAEPTDAADTAATAAERIAAMLRDGRPGLLA